MTGFCTACGNQFREDDRFCAKCGTSRDLAPRSSAPVAAPSSSSNDEPAKKSGCAIPSVVFLILGFGLIPLVFFAGDCDDSAEGSVVVTGGPRPAFTFRPTGCASMQPYGRFGANIHGAGPNDGAVYVTRDPTRGNAIEIEIPGSCRNTDGTDCTVFPLPRDSCRTFDVDVDFSGVTVNDVRLVEGHVAMDCTLPDGTTVRGRVTFDGC